MQRADGNIDFVRVALHPSTAPGRRTAADLRLASPVDFGQPKSLSSDYPPHR